MFWGIDPSQRHTGLCFYGGGPTYFNEITTEGLDVLSSGLTIRRSLIATFRALEGGTTAAFCVEHQLPVGGQSSALLFHIMMCVLEAINHVNPNPTILLPLPIQLQSYVAKRHGSPTKGRPYVEQFQRTFGHTGRISQHRVDAYYLARLAEDVANGTWEYKLPSKQAALTPWSITNGTARNQRV